MNSWKVLNNFQPKENVENNNEKGKTTENCSSLQEPQSYNNSSSMHPKTAPNEFQMHPQSVPKSSQSIDKASQKIPQKILKHSESISEHRANKVDRIVAFLMGDENQGLEIDDNNSLVSFEEGERRIILILIFLAIVFSIVASTYLYFTVKLKSKSDMIIYLNYTESKLIKESNPLNRIHLSLIDVEGKILDFTVQNNNFKHKWTLKLPYLHDFLFNYFTFTHNHILFAIYGDKKKDITSINSGGKHKTLKNSKIPKTSGPQTMIVKVNSYIWIFGGDSKHASEMQQNHDQFKSLLWSIKKQKWIKAPVFPFEDWGIPSGCAIAIDRDIVTIISPFFYFPETLDFLDFSYNFATNQWIFNGNAQDLSNSYVGGDMTCEKYFDKSGKL